MPLRRVVTVLALCALSIPAFALSTRSIDSGLTAQEVATTLTGPGASISNVTITGSGLAVGTFSDGDALGIPRGVMLSTGNIADAAGANTAPDAGAALGTSGHYTLDPIVDPYKTFDAAVIEFDVVTATPTFAIRYVFGSEEYREYVGSEFNDVFAFFVDGANIALTPGSTDPVTVNSINHLQNTGLYRDNEGGAATQLDGYTVPMIAVAVVEPGVPHHIRIAIADTSDQILDSAVFIAEQGISGNPIAPVVIPDFTTVNAAIGETIEIPLSVYYTTIERDPNLSASGLPDMTASFSPLTQAPDGRLRSTLTLTVGPGTPSGAQVLTINSRTGDTIGSTTVLVVVDCKPPAILGTGQPQTTVAERGTSATLHVDAQGTGPFTYEWFAGFKGMTSTPVAGATGATLTTGPVNETTSYWVRVRNACGSADSNTALVVSH